MKKYILFYQLIFYIMVILILLMKTKKHGKLIVSLLTDKAISSKKRLPLLNFKQRKKIIENIKGVDQVVPKLNGTIQIIY